jgi:ribosome-binding factor A
MRTRRLASLLQAELADLLKRRTNDPRLSRVTLTGVDISPDLSQAKVYFTLYDEKYRKEAEAGFKAASAFLRGKLANILHLKTMPRLLPVFDRSIDEALYMENLIRKTIDADNILTEQEKSKN